jgi:DDE family transposase
MHIYHVASGTPIVTILRPARTPRGTEVRTVIKHVTKRMRRHWPKTRIVWRGDSHYGRVKAMEWAEDNDTDYIFGLAGNAALDALVAEAADNLRFHHAMSSKAKLRSFVSLAYKANSWKRPRKVVARLECSLQPVAGKTGMRQEVDIRYVVTSLKGSGQHLYENAGAGRWRT